MAVKKAGFTWLLIVGLCLVVCQRSQTAELKRNKIVKRYASAQAPAPAPAPAPAAAAKGAPAAAAKSETKCAKSLDVLFVLDSSEKIGKDNWDKIINSTIDIAAKFDLKFARFGVIQYQSYAECVIKVMKFSDQQSLADTLRKIFYKNGGKRTDLALNSTINCFEEASVRSGSKVVILITGGPSADVYIDSKKYISGADLLLTPADQLHKAEIAVYYVGVQTGLSDDDKKTMTAQSAIIASKPTADHVIEVADFDKLVAECDKIANKTCVVNGGWSEWSAWSACRHPCMVKMRTRECNKPAPESGGLNCTGPKVEQFPCGSSQECQSNPKPVPPKPSGPTAHGVPDPKNCANGVEVVKLLDHQLDASSSYVEGYTEAEKTQSRIDHMPSMGQVNSTKGRGAWCADHAKAVAKDKSQYIQIDLGSVVTTGMVQVQGQRDYPNWVTKLKLNCSVDGVNWLSYGKVLDGSTDQNSPVGNYLNPAIGCRFIRFIPQEWTVEDICMRVAVLKCRASGLVPLVKDMADMPEDAWADKWANATRKSLIAKRKNVKVLASKGKRLAKKKH